MMIRALFRALWHVVFIVFVAVATVGAAPRVAEARGEDARRAGTVRLEAVGQRDDHGLELTAKDAGSYAGELAIINDGKEPLVVSRIAVRGDAADPRAPAKLVARLGEGVLPLTIPPGASRKATVQWTPERGIRLRQLFAHVVVTTSDELSGEVAMGVRAQIPGPIGFLDGRVLSLIVALPVLGAALLFALRALGRRDDRTMHGVAIGALLLQTMLAAYVYRGFAPDVSRIDGNDGLQFVEHAVWIRALSAEVFLGVDGIAATTLLVTSLVALLGLLRDRRAPSGASGYHATYLVLAAAVPGALCAMDGLLFVLFTSIAVMAATTLASGWGAFENRRAAVRLGLFGAIAVVCLLVVVLALARHADPTFLVDGTKTSTSFSLPELSRVAFGAKGAKLFGAALVKVAFVLVFVASLVLLGAFPVHGWLVAVVDEAAPATSALVSASLPTIGICVLLRFGCAVLPEGMRWASGVVVALGAVTAVYGALLALVEVDLRRLAAYVSVSQIGFVLLGAGSLTPQGFSAAIVLASTRAIGCALFLFVTSALVERAHVRDGSRLAGVGSQMRGWSVAFGVAGLAQAGIMGVGGAWGPLLAMLGAFPNYAPLALAAAFALVVNASAQLRAIARLVFGRIDEAWSSSPELAPFGGRFPDLTSREWLRIGPLVVVIVALGLWPAPLLATTTGIARDLTNAVNPPGPDQIAMHSSGRNPKGACSNAG